MLLAVRAQDRGRGGAWRLLADAERLAEEKQWTAIFLHAQPVAVPFYTRAGYHPATAEETRRFETHEKQDQLPAEAAFLRVKYYSTVVLLVKRLM